MFFASLKVKLPNMTDWHNVCLLSLRACASKLQISRTNVDIGFTADFDRSLDSFVNKKSAI